MKERVALWKRIYEADENSINQQISKLAWDLAAFTCFVELVRRAPDSRSGKQLNGMFMDMLVSGLTSPREDITPRLVGGFLGGYVKRKKQKSR
ncbi:hypothetical protein FKV24_012415 [Lysobacter maris]|uniref:Uncharacterized protein n=1 Tax=Marilutibacter maris TaxID=1605891 RepID=A0A508AJW2_9GAMM|nr:hypothetical protein [Lysobacter maris]KAB8180496.1 hypothetical protein FKV24_012415 [Lysobacter maris]